MLPVELIQRILLFANDLDAAIATELLLARFPRPFWFRPDLLTYKYVMRAAGAGRLDLIRILDEFDVPRFCMGTKDEAAAAGHLAIVKFLHFNCTEGCTSWAMTKPAISGFLDVLPFLHTNGTEGCRESALMDAAVNGHFDIVSFLQTEMRFFPDIDSRWGSRYEHPKIPTHYIRRLHEEFGWPITELVFCDVMSRGTPEEFRYCLDKLKKVHLTFDKNGLGNVFRYERRSWLENLKILFEDIGDDDQYWEPENLDWLARHGHLKMLKFLYERRKERCTCDGLARAAEFGHVRVFEFLIAKDPKASSMIDVKVLKPAIETGNPARWARWIRSLDLAPTFPSAQVPFVPPFEAIDSDVLQFLHNNRHEEPDANCLEEAAWQSFEVIKLLVEEVGMRPNVEVMRRAACSTRTRAKLDVVKFLYDYFPADAPLNQVISVAITNGRFEVAKFLHMKRRITGLMTWKLDEAVNMDVEMFAVENYLSQVNIDNAMGPVKSIHSDQMDVCKYIVEAGHLRHRELEDENTEIDLDSLRYLLKDGSVNVELLLAHLRHYRDVSIEFCPERFTPQTVNELAETNRVPALRYLSHVAPHLFDSAAVDAIICFEPSDAHTEQMRLILDRHSEHVKWHDHLAVAVQNNTTVAMLLWERWPGGCPRKAMEVACRARNSKMLAKLLERIDAKGKLPWSSA
ncbi:hypothetical protein HDU96_004503 [Phlyctochytrium bullatum]|nr:hypothetical protein HDU96_004503 [Phlyctochytrium bullatum]